MLAFFFCMGIQASASLRSFPTGPVAKQIRLRLAASTTTSETLRMLALPGFNEKRRNRTGRVDVDAK
jgi:hypothetical protein